MKVNNNSTV